MSDQGGIKQPFLGIVATVVVFFIAFGIIVWFVMNLVVLPLSNVRHAPFQLRAAGIAAFILVICIGLPLSLGLGRLFRDRDRA